MRQTPNGKETERVRSVHGKRYRSREKKYIEGPHDATLHKDGQGNVCIMSPGRHTKSTDGTIQLEKKGDAFLRNATAVKI